MRAACDFLLYEMWHIGKAPGLVAAGIICALPLVLLYSALRDNPPPSHEIRSAAIDTWTGRLVDYRIDHDTNIVAVVAGSRGTTEIILAGIEVPSRNGLATTAALKWLRRATRPGEVVEVYSLRSPPGCCAIVGHVTRENLWINGSLIERGLARVAPRPVSEASRVTRATLLQLQDQAQYHQRGIWDNR